MRLTNWRTVLGASLLTFTSCASTTTSPHPSTKPEAIRETKLDQTIAALSPAKLAASDAARAIDAALETHFARFATKRGYLMTDKPLYQPGETIWVRADLRATGTLVGAGAKPVGANLQLVSPRGAIVAQKRIAIANGVGQNDFALDAAIDGGEYTLQLTADDGTSDAKKLIVNTYEAPRLKKTLEFIKKAYGAGDTVTAAIEVARTTGEPFADRALTGVVTVDDVEVARIPLKTDGAGKTTAKFQLPQAIARGDGLLTIMADDGGLTESIQKRIPIVMKSIALDLFPEGGDLVEGLPSRVYFAAKTPLGKPADIEGKVLDDRGTVVADLASIHDGMGRFELAPAADRTYHIEISRPAGIAQKFALPAAKSGGCVVRSVNAHAPDKLRVAAICSTSRTVIVEAALREKHVAGGAVEVAANTPALVELPIDASAQGAVRVTLLSQKPNAYEPLAERLVYHGRGTDMHVKLVADRATYSPRDPVKLEVTATDANGKPVKASLGVAVVDDTVLSFADDKSAKMQAHLFLEPELGVNPSDPATAIEEPNFYFGDKPEAAAAMDALLGTRGYRRFEWQQVFAPPPPVQPSVAFAPMEDDMGIAAGGMNGVALAPQMAPPPQGMVPGNAKAPVVHAAMRGDMQKARKEAIVQGDRPVMQEKQNAGRARGGDFRFRDKNRIGKDEDGVADNNGEWAPVRVFPVPTYAAHYDGPREDFRETIYWNGDVETDANGHAQVAFVASDAVTSFRATAEGVSAGGTPGAGEVVIKSKLPVSLDAKLPTEVTEGDRLLLPITVTNETALPVDSTVDAQFGVAFGSRPYHQVFHLAPHEKHAELVALDVKQSHKVGDADVAIEMTTGGLHDEIKKTIAVVPLGFPFEVKASGTARGSTTGGTTAEQTLDLAGALPGSISATVTMYPSPLASMTQGMAQMIREPGGCFEQTSSTNYPNIMILSYLESNDGADAALVGKTQGVLDKGYKLLTGYETSQKGYEWFGHTPGHEALTAYGLMEFADMGKVYDVDHAMVQRTADWLMSRRDGKGGFLRSSEALDSFGRASEKTTSAYIMWALAEANRVKGMDKELAAQQQLGETTKDPYLLALATNTALLAKQPSAPAMVKRLVELQSKDGSFAGAKESITMSGGESLAIEATSLATLALIKASPNNEYEGAIRGAVDYLNAHRGGYGGWSNTQSTILGLKAMTAYTEHARQMAAGGEATLMINGKAAGTVKFDKGRKDALIWDDVAAYLKPGKNTVELELDSTASLPYTVAVEYRSAHPQTAPATRVSLTTSLDRATMKLGEGVELRAHVENTTAGGLPMTLARIGIPGGLVFQTWQLKELRDKGLIEFYETRPREVILYWRALAPNAKHDISLDLLASTPGTYEAPASSAYLYYTAEDKAWTPPVKVDISK